MLKSCGGSPEEALFDPIVPQDHYDAFVFLEESPRMTGSRRQERYPERIQGTSYLVTIRLTDSVPVGAALVAALRKGTHKGCPYRFGILVPGGGRRPEPMAEVSVRYMIDDVPAAIRFYTELLGFTLEHDASPAFAAVSRDGVRLLLSGEGSSGKRPLPDGERQVPGGWNRIHLQVADLDVEVRRLRAAGIPFRTPEIVTGPGGAQVILEDPSGNPVELFEPRQ